MKQTKGQQKLDMNDAEEYDFSKMKNLGRGRYFRELQQGYSITIHKTDGSTEVQQVPPQANVIVLDPDLHEYFPDSDAVNRALRGLLALVLQRAV